MGPRHSTRVATHCSETNRILPHDAEAKAENHLLINIGYSLRSIRIFMFYEFTEGFDLTAADMITTYDEGIHSLSTVFDPPKGY